MNQREEIRKELKEITPYLAGLDIRPAFKVPVGYFDELSDSVLESVSPLSTLNKKSAFTVPKNYFASLPDLILEQVETKEDKVIVQQPVSNERTSWIDDLISSVAVFFQPRYALRLASLAIVLIGGFVVIKNAISPVETVVASNDFEVIENPLEEYGISLEDLTDDDLSLLLSDLGTPGGNEEIDPLLNELLNDLEDINDADLEDFL